MQNYEVRIEETEKILQKQKVCNNLKTPIHKNGERNQANNERNFIINQKLKELMV